jgi:hypothetical protein
MVSKFRWQTPCKRSHGGCAAGWTVSAVWGQSDWACTSVADGDGMHHGQLEPRSDAFAVSKYMSKVWSSLNSVGWHTRETGTWSTLVLLTAVSVVQHPPILLRTSVD